MGKLLQIRVSAWTYDEDEVKANWKNLFALAWPYSSSPGGKCGVLELVTALENGMALGGWPGLVEERLKGGIEQAGELKRRLEQALADWDPRLANRLSDDLEDVLFHLEEQAPPA